MRKEFANHSARKHQPTSWRISKHCTLKYRQSPRPQKDKFPQRLLWSRRRRATTALSYNIQMKLWEKANIGGFRHHNYCGSTLPSMARPKENKLPPSFSGFKSQRFLYDSSHDGVSGYNERSVKNSASVFHFWLLEAFSRFQNGSILLVSKRRSFIIEEWIIG